MSLALDQYVDSLSDDEGDHDVDLESDCDDCDYYVEGAPSFPLSAASNGSPPASSATGGRSCYGFSSTARSSSSVHGDGASFSSTPGSCAPPSPEGDPGAFPLPSFGLVHPLLPNTESDALKAPAPDSQKPPQGDAPPPPLDQGKAARRKRKSQRKHEQRSFKRKVDQPAQPTLQKALKEVARRRAAEAQTLIAGDSFSPEDLPVNKGAWSGLRQIFEKILPDVATLTGEEYKLELVPWNGK